MIKVPEKRNNNPSVLSSYGSIIGMFKGWTLPFACKAN